ncbi:MAG: DUF3791 domain-containing protein [Clostridiales bacterium]|nr:DUF3791 domain-containing protein [Clostridiales bacterium]
MILYFFLQANVASAYRKSRGLTVSEFNNLDRKYNILRYLEIGYEPFHLTGTQGVIDEIEEYVRVQQDRIKQSLR